MSGAVLVAQKGGPTGVASESFLGGLKSAKIGRTTESDPFPCLSYATEEPGHSSSPTKVHELNDSADPAIRSDPPIWSEDTPYQLTCKSTLYSSTPEGQSIRRDMLRGCVLVFISSGYSAKRFIYVKAKELGVRVVVIDFPGSWVEALENEGLIEKYVPLDFSNVETAFELCLQAVEKVKEYYGAIHGITSFCDMAVPLATRLAEKLNLPCNPPEAVANARDKFKTREVMESFGLPSVKHFLIADESQLDDAVREVGFPAVLKPMSGSGSIGVLRCDSHEDLLKAYQRVKKDMQHAIVSTGDLYEGHEDPGNGAPASGWINLNILMEEYLDGQEVDMDLVFSEGHCVYGGITDNGPTVEPYFHETISNCPSLLPRHQQHELMELGVKAVQALGFKLGVFHVEGKYTSKGARLIEVNCRMGGDAVRDFNLLVWGVDLVEEHITVSVGIPSRPLIAHEPLKQIAENDVNARKSGILQNVDFLKPWQSHPDVVFARPDATPGTRCLGIGDGLPTWICHIMVAKPTVKEAIAMVKDIEEHLDVPIE